eukprot:jgi/Psemu1/3311/gm1.3311_g
MAHASLANDQAPAPSLRHQAASVLGFLCHSDATETITSRHLVSEKTAHSVERARPPSSPRLSFRLPLPESDAGHISATELARCHEILDPSGNTGANVSSRGRQSPNQTKPKESDEPMSWSP